MDVILVILAVICVVIGVIGSVLPALPGPPISYIGLLFMQWSNYGNYSSRFMILWAVVVLIITLADYYLPIYITKRVGGSRRATIGATLGLVVGMFAFPPLGMIVCPFLGALIGELMNNRNNSTKAFKVAFGSFIAFFIGTGAKLIISGVIFYYVVVELFV